MANFPKGDSFFRLLKETAPSPIPSVEKKPESNSQFKLKTSLFHQRIAPTEQQKQSILKDILDNNINHIYNTEILPQERREVQKREQMEFEIEILDKPSSSVLYKPPVTIQQRRAPSPVKEVPEYQKLWPIKFENGRQPSMDNPLRKSSEDDSDDSDKFEDRDVYKEVRVREYKMADIKPSSVLRERQKTQDRIKEENMEKLKNELKAMNAAAKKKEDDNREEIRRKADESARQNAEKIRQYKLKMKESEQNRMESLLKSNGQMITDRFGNVSQSINKQRKNTDPLIKFLLSHKYYQQKMPIQQAMPIPDEFDSYISYQQTFQPLMMNEYISNIQKNIESLLKDRSDSKCIKCTMRIHNKKEEEGDDDYTIVELQESKDQDQTDNIISYQHKNTSEVFNLSFANNYLILISFSKEFSLDQVNREDYRNGVPIIGFINTMDKSNIRETPKAKIMVNYNDFRRALKKEWTTCYVRPIDKITTFLREYISLNCFAYSDVNQYVFRPRIASNIIAPENNVFYKKFFGNIKAKYNEGQLAAIQDVCLSKNGICLLQGPPGTGKTHTLVGIVSGLYHYLKSSKTTHRRYIMICTPSNTAVDEIILRIKQNGLYGENGETIHPNIVRIGVLDRDPHELVKQCALENLAHKEILKLKSKDKSPFAKEATLTELKDEIAKITKRIQNVKQSSAADKKVLDELHEKRRVLYDQLYDYKAVKVGEKEKHDQITQSILYSADIICCTLNSAGSEKLERFRDYIEAIIVDEAGQATEPSNIIPLQYSPKKLILIGDPKQLPAVTFANDTQITKFNRSLFERILDCGVNAFFLYEQYRMVSSIRKFPSMYFYQDRLTDALSVQQRKFPAYLSQLQNRNVIFLDLPFSRESMIDHSYYNTSELNTCVAVLEFLMSKINTGAYGRKHAIGCISPYKKQVLLLNDRLREKYGNEYRDSITANTVDAFQGQEKDVIIFSTVRANALAGTKGQDRNVIGFLNDVRRMNVAITRPKFVLVIVGNSTTLATDETWRAYIDHLIQQQCYVNVPAAHQIDKVVQSVLNNEQLATYLTSPPDLPLITPKKIKRDPRSENSFSEGIRTPKQAASTFPRHDLEQVQAVSLFPSFQRLTSGYEDIREKENNYQDGKRLWNNKDSHTSEYFTDAVFSQIEDLEKIEKKRKLNEKNREVKIHQEPGSAEKNTTGKSSVLSSLLGEKSATNSAKKSSSGGSGLSSLFARTPEKKEPEDQGPSILKSLFNF